MKLADIKQVIADGEFEKAIRILHLFEYDYANEEEVLLIVNIYLAECYHELGNLSEAERYYKKVVSVQRNNINAWTKLETILREQARYKECREILEIVKIEMPPLTGVVDTSLSMLDLIEGNLKDGFRGYENRFAFKHMGEAYKETFFPRWDGTTSIEGKSILLRYEQGLGDTIQYSRFANDLKDAGAEKVGILCKKTLHRLVKLIHGIDEVYETPPKSMYDYEIMLMSCPAALGISSEDELHGGSYMMVNPSDSDVWKNKLSNFNKMKVGLVWAGDSKVGLGKEAIQMNSRRSIPLDMLRPLLDADCDFFSLQKGASLDNFFGLRKINDFMGEVNDFYDTACLINNLDLVICVDTSTAHLAGAMGKPVWMLNRLDGDWRWMLNRDDSPWYSSMKIYRQETYRNWSNVITKVADDLEKMV